MGGCSLAPNIILEEIEKPFYLEVVSTSDGSTRKPEYLKLNPKGRLPVLIADGSVLTEAPAILLRLSISDHERSLIPSSTEDLVRSIEWFNWVSGIVHAVAIRQIWRPESFTDDKEQYEAITQKGKKNLADVFAYINSRLTKRDWALENHYSIVDAYLLVF